MKLTHRQIEIFRAILRAGQVTSAAQALQTSQPTLSRELARLEQRLGFTLFDRVRGRLQPTATALAWMAEIDRSFVGLDRIAAAAAALKSFDHARLTIACQPALTHALLPHAIERVLAQQPRANVALTPAESPLLEQWLSEQRYDLGLTEHGDTPPGTARETLLAGYEVAVLPAGDPLLAAPRLSLQDFSGRRFISLDPQDAYRQHIDRLFAQAGCSANSAWTPPALCPCALVQRGLGVAIVNPLTALAMESATLHLRALEVAIPFHVSMVRPELRPASALLDSFQQALRMTVATLQPRLAALAPPG